MGGRKRRSCWWCVGPMLLLAAGCAPAHSKPALLGTRKPAPPPNEDTVQYCAGTVTEYEVHRCIWQLTPDEQRHRPYSQRLTFRGGRLTRMDTISGSGTLVQSQNSSTFDYRGGRVWTTSWTNRNGVPKGGSEYDADLRIVHWRDAEGRPKPNEGSKASGLLRKLDAKGRVVSYTYVDYQGRPTPYEGRYEVRVRRNEQGAIVEESYFDDKGQPVLDQGGAHRVEHVPDQHGADREVRYFDDKGAPTLVRGAHLRRMKSDAFGNELERAFFGLDGQPAVSEDHGAALVRYTRDQHGNETVRELFGTDGRPVIGDAGFTRRERRFDDQDLPIEWKFYGPDGALIRLKETGCPVMRQTRDANGNVVVERFYDEDANPMATVEGYHRVEIGYDARDNPNFYRYTAADGSPVMIPNRYHFKTISYDGDRPLRTSFFDKDHRPATIDKGYAAYEVIYAADGSELEKKFFDADSLQQKVCNGRVSEALQAALQERAASTRSCYERLLGTRPDADGELIVALRLSSEGQVLSSKVERNKVRGDATFTDCVLSTLSESYPVGVEGDDCADVRIPLKFKPKQAP